MKKALFLMILTFLSVAKSEVGQRPDSPVEKTYSSDRIYCVHSAGDVSKPIGDDQSAADRFQVLLPSAGSGVLLNSEKFQFNTSVRTIGPDGFVDTPMSGVFTMSLRNIATLDISGEIQIFNPYMQAFDLLSEGTPSIYLDSLNYFKNRLRDKAKDRFRADYQPKSDKIAGGFFCVPVSSFEQHPNPDNVRVIQATPAL